MQKLLKKKTKVKLKKNISKNRTQKYFLPSKKKKNCPPSQLINHKKKILYVNRGERKEKCNFLFLVQKKKFCSKLIVYENNLGEKIHN